MSNVQCSKFNVQCSAVVVVPKSLNTDNESTTSLAKTFWSPTTNCILICLQDLPDFNLNYLIIKINLVRIINIHPQDITMKVLTSLVFWSTTCQSDVLLNLGCCWWPKSMQWYIIQNENLYSQTFWNTTNGEKLQKHFIEMVKELSIQNT